MQLTTVFRDMGRNDARIVRRDSFLIWMILLPFFDAALLRWGLPFAAAQLAGRFDLLPLYPLFVSYVIVQMVPVLMGTLIGFLLLDERDDNTLQALLVTPLPLHLYLGYRVAAPLLLSLVLIVITVPLTGLVEMPFLPLLLTALIAALLAPAVSLFFVAFAENKVQGFAVLKVLGTIALVHVAAYFIPLPWQYLVGIIFPPYWVGRAFWSIAAGESNYLIYLVPGLLSHAILLALLIRRFYRMAYEQGAG